MADSDKTFAVADYIIFLGTVLFSVAIGVYYAFVKKQSTNEDLLVGGRQMAILPIALSLLATYMSAILILGFTGEIYSCGTIMAVMAFGALFYIPFSGFLFLPTLYNLKLTSAYEYLEKRFESRIVRFIASGTFITQIILYMGVVIFAPSLALNVVGDFPIWISILMIGGSAGIYTAIGGIKAVVWTDVFQALMMFSGMLAIIIIGSINVGGLSNAFDIVNKHDRIEFFDWSLDPFKRHTTLGLFFGTSTFWLSGYGCHQTTVQRYCSMSSLNRARTALYFTAPLVFFTMSLAVLSGVVIFANYAGCDPLTLGLIKRADQIAPHFVLEFLTETPGLLGLFNACLLSGALSTVSSGLNSLAAVTWEDFLKDRETFVAMTEKRKSLIVKGIGFLYAIATIIMGFIATNLGSVLTVAITVNGAVNGTLLGVFLLGVFFPLANKYGAIIGMITGHVVTLWIAFGSLSLGRKVQMLPFRIDECSENITSTVNMTAVLIRQASLITPPPDLDWPSKIYTLSYVLQPLVGLSLTLIVGVIVSVFTGPRNMTKDDEKFIHPLAVKFYRKVEKKFRFCSCNDRTDSLARNSTTITLKNVVPTNRFRTCGNGAGAAGKLDNDNNVLDSNVVNASQKGVVKTTNVVEYDNPSFKGDAEN